MRPSLECPDILPIMQIYVKCFLSKSLKEAQLMVCENKAMLNKKKVKSTPAVKGIKP